MQICVFSLLMWLTVCSVAAASITVPRELILADEPTGSLDEENKKTVFSLLKNLQKTGKTIILVTHDKALLKDVDRVIDIKKTRKEHVAKHVLLIYGIIF